MEQQVCIFCHTPHAAASVQPLWNRASPVVPYTVYASGALDAQVDQPTGASKMCLSCHDGSIALGSVLSRDQVIEMAGVISTLPPGASNLGTDLSDDHPISFAYDTALAGRDPFLVDPAGLPFAVRLPGGDLQCTTCHDPHDDSYGDFLVMDNADSSLCISCHQISDTTITAHQECRACHRTHSAPSGPFLLVEDDVTSTCTRCHDGSGHGAANILADLRKVSVHDTAGTFDATDRTAHSSCTDCHDPHTMTTGPPPRAPNMAASLGQIRRTFDRGGAREGTLNDEYEVCFRCHGDENLAGLSPTISRVIAQTSTRLQFDPSAPSFHPVMAPGRSTEVPSLRAGWTESSLVLCSDCHGSDTSRKAGGSGPNGVHGSNHPPLLLERYDSIDFSPESSAAYALCYRCHNRDGFGGILQDRSFPHRVHVVDSRTPCSACHDAHGISSAQGTRRNNSHLINFDTSIVFPDPVSGRMEFVDQGTFSGSCTVSCHGVVHQQTTYDQ
jgi:predicted CXXCH cytochrome family protein